MYIYMYGFYINIDGYRYGKILMNCHTTPRYHVSPRRLWDEAAARRAPKGELLGSPKRWVYKGRSH